MNAMSTATVEQQDHLYADSLPLIDLRRLSQAELLSLSRSSASPVPSSQDDSDVCAPKIDRSVFNESAGSRKQTFSRLRLAPRNQQYHNQSTSAARETLISRQQQSICDEENSRIVKLLKGLFRAAGDSFSENDVDVNDSNNFTTNKLVTAPIAYTEDFELQDSDSDGTTKRKRGRPRRNVNMNTNTVFDESKALVVYSNPDEKEMVMVNKNGVLVDLAVLGEAIDPYREELRRRTQGVETEEGLLGFLSGMPGDWGSRRKRRKIVDADDLGDFLPRGWKVILWIKKKDDRAWLACRSYISPNGLQFLSCKEVSSYLLSYFGLQDNKPLDSRLITDNIQITEETASQNAVHQDVEEDSMINVVVERREDLIQCHKCPLAFNEGDDLAKHLIRDHRSKMSKRNILLAEQAIMKDGQFECQFCRRLYEERHRYHGHLGNHVKSYLSKNEASARLKNSELVPALAGGSSSPLV